MQADKLMVIEVSDGGFTQAQVVTNATNVEVGLKIAFAPVGSEVRHVCGGWGVGVCVCGIFKIAFAPVGSDVRGVWVWVCGCVGVGVGHAQDLPWR
jgi:hypothetical protein